MLASVLWGLHTAPGFDDVSKVIRPALQAKLKDLYPLSASVASSPEGWQRSIASALAIYMSPPLAARPQAPQGAQHQQQAPPVNTQVQKRGRQGPASGGEINAAPSVGASGGSSAAPAGGGGGGAVAGGGGGAAAPAGQITAPVAPGSSGPAVRELWTTQPPFLPPADNKFATSRSSPALVAAVPRKLISYFYRDSAHPS